MSSALDSRAIFESVSDAIIVCSETGHAIDCNAAALALLRCTREQLIGSTPLDWSPETQPDGRRSDTAAAEVFARALLGEVVHFDWINVCHDGTAIEVQATVSLIRSVESKTFVVISRDASAIKTAERQLAKSEDRFRTLFENAPLAYQSLDMAANILAVNDAWLKLLGGVRREDVIGQSITRFLEEKSLPTLAENFPAFIKRGHIEGPVFDLHRADGQARTVTINGRIGYDAEGNALCTHCILTDITERTRIEMALRESEATFRKLFEDSSDPILLIDNTDVFVECNQSALDLLKMSREQFLLLPPDRISPEFQPDGRRSAEAAPEMIALAYRKGLHRFDWTCINAEGGEFIVEVSLMPIAIKGQTMLHTTWRDITERKASADKIERLAFYDPLTDLPNRRLVLDRLEQALSASSRHHRYGALLLLDMDDFKTLNDTLGHDIGDQFLVEVARRLQASVREGDTVARHGGDEFVVILEDLNENALAAMQAESVAVKILRAVSQPYLLDLAACEGLKNTRNYHCTSSIGITLFQGNAISVDELMKRADTAMYQAKAAGRNALRFFDPEMQAVVTARAALDHDLREAMREDQFCLYYQPQVDSAGKRTGAEALLRWQHPRRGMVPPGEFIPQAEATGLIIPLGDWVLETACAQLVAWSKQPDMSHLTVAVNVSARQFRHADFVDHVLTIISSTGANPKKLKLELTESLLLENVEEVIAKMSALKAEGIGFSLDDFGTGYSSLSYLKRLPLDQLKIDGAFVRDVLTDPNDAAIARTIVALAQSMGLSVIAECVETQAQREFLAANGCTAFQGYLFGRPMPIEDF
jgi:diguanylate cyclase (GGDEF)-like protein/PAS domain S-box-containing protein